MGLITSPAVGVLRLANGSRKLIGGSKELVEELNREDPSSVKVALEATRTLSGTVDTIQVLTATYREWLETVLQPTVKSLDKSELTAEQLEKIFKKVQKIPVSAIKKPAKALEIASGSFVDVAEGLSPLIDAVEKQVELTLSKLSIIEKQLSFGAKTLLLFEASLRTTIILRDSLERDISFAEATRQHLRVFIEDFIVEEGKELEFDNGDIDALAEVGLAEEEVLLDLPTAIAESFTELREGFDDRYKARTEAILMAQETLQSITDNVNELGPGFSELVSATEGLQEFLDSIGVIEAIGDFTDIVAGLSDLSDILELVVDAVEPIFDIPLVSDLSDLIDEAINSVPGVAELEKQIKDGIESLITELSDAIAAQLGDLPAGLFVPQIALLQAIIAAFELLDELVREIARPIGQSDDETGTDDTIDFTAIAVSTSGNDTIALELDTEFDEDGLGGFALGRGGDKTVIGTLRPDLVLTQDGDDKINTKDGDDVIISGSGDDTISAGKGNDDVVAGDGVDRVTGGDGDDQLYGASGDDSLFGGAGSDLIDGGRDNDYLEAGEEADPETIASDTLRGGDGDDTLVATAGDNVLDGGDGLDEIRTLGAVDATHLILDSSIRLLGGAGRDIVELEDDYALGAPIMDGVILDAGANFDTLKAGSLDLDTLDAIDPLTGFERIQNFETLHITALAGETKTLITDVDSLNNFQTLILEAEGVEFGEADNGRGLTPEEFGAIIIEVTGGDFVMSGFDSNFPLIIDNSRLADLVNPHDGPQVDDIFPFFNSFVHSSKLNAMTIRAAGDLATNGAVLTGNQATSDGFTFEGGSGADTITGGGGSDVIRAGEGEDVINGGVSDSGNKFSNDSAVGDVIIGTPNDFNGDQIFNLTNRVDRIRIEGSQDYFIQLFPEFSAEGEVIKTIVEIYLNESESGPGDILSAFTIDGDNPKLTVRGGSYIPLGATEAVDYVELFNNNVPPVAVSDLVETRNLGDGDLDGTLFNPFENDFDPDAEVITNDDGSITRRQINEPASVLALLRQLSEADPNMPAVEVGARFETELGNKVFYTQAEIDGVLVDQLFYEARDPSVTLRMIETGDAVGGFPTDVYDPTEALPFFGFDRIVYTNIDDEDETSDFAAINFIVRPDRVTDANGDLVLPSVEIFGVLDGQVIEQVEVQLNELAPNTSAIVLDDQLTPGNTSPNAFLNTTFQNSDYLDIDAAGTYFASLAVMSLMRATRLAVLRCSAVMARTGLKAALATISLAGAASTIST